MRRTPRHEASELRHDRALLPTLETPAHPSQWSNKVLSRFPLRLPGAHNDGPSDYGGTAALSVT